MGRFALAMVAVLALLGPIAALPLQAGGQEDPGPSGDVEVEVRDSLVVVRVSGVAGRFVPALWGAAAAVGPEVYTPAGTARLPCSPEWLAASADGKIAYASCNDSVLYMIYFGGEGGASVSAHPIPRGYRPAAYAALVYMGALYLPLEGARDWGYLVAYAPSRGR